MFCKYILHQGLVHSIYYEYQRETQYSINYMYISYVLIKLRKSWQKLLLLYSLSHFLVFSPLGVMIYTFLIDMSVYISKKYDS